MGMEDDQEFDPTHYEFPTQPYDGLFAIGTKLFIFESGMRIGLGTIVRQNDDWMLVRIEFTVEPRLKTALYYGLVSEAAGLGEGQ